MAGEARGAGREPCRFFRPESAEPHSRPDLVRLWEHWVADLVAWVGRIAVGADWVRGLVSAWELVLPLVPVLASVRVSASVLVPDWELVLPLVPASVLVRVPVWVLVLPLVPGSVWVLVLAPVWVLVLAPVWEPVSVSVWEPVLSVVELRAPPLAWRDSLWAYLLQLQPHTKVSAPQW